MVYVGGLDSHDEGVLTDGCCQGFNENGEQRGREWATLSGPPVKSEAL